MKLGDSIDSMSDKNAARHGAAVATVAFEVILICRSSRWPRGLTLGQADFMGCRKKKRYYHPKTRKQKRKKKKKQSLSGYIAVIYDVKFDREFILGYAPPERGDVG